MLRAGLLSIGLVILAALAWLSLDPESRRADFVVASDTVRTIDPARVSWLDEIQIASAVFEGLTRLHPLTLLPEPAAAESWNVDAAQQEYVFHLRPSARWSNGDPLLAEHFRFAWLRALDPAVQSQYAAMLFVIAGAEDFYRSRLNADEADDLPAERVGVEAPDERTLRVRLARPCPYFLDLTSFPTFAPLHPPTLERWAYRDGRVLRATSHLWARPAAIVSNGAFLLTRWDFKRRLWLQRNPRYWEAAAPAAGRRLDEIEILITADPSAALLAYETGRIDLARGLEPSVARVLMQRQAAGRRDDFHLGDRFATYFFRVNCRRPPLDDARVRRALSLAIDRAALCEHVLGLGETPAETYVPRGSLPLMPRLDRDGTTIFYAPPAPPSAGMSHAERIELARRLLRESGFDPASAQRPIELAFAPEPPQQRRVAEAVQAMWERALGLHAQLRMLERNVLSQKIRDLDYDIVRSDWYGDYLDPMTFLDMYVSGSGQNRTGWSDPRYDALIHEAAAEADNRRRFERLSAAEARLCEQAPIIPLYFKRGNYLLRTSFGGVADNVRDILPIHRVVRLAEQPR